MITNTDKKSHTLPCLLKQRAADTPHAIAFMEKQAGRWKGISWQHFHNQALCLATGLIRAGVEPGDELAILMPNSIEWEIVQHAGFMAGCVVVGLDPRDPLERLARLLEMTRIRVLAVPGTDLLRRFSPDLLGSLKLILMGSGPIPHDRFNQARRIAGLMTAADPGALPRIEKTHCAALLFTSGTTGDPKTISYGHDQLMAAANAIARQIPNLPDQARSACWLPLSSPFQRMITYCGMLMNHRTFMVQDPAAIMAAAKEIAPHFMAGVPRFYEKIYHAFTGRSAVLPPPQTLFGTHIRFFISGSAPMPVGLLEKFHRSGWLILESYGVSENIIPMSMNTTTAYQLGTVGKPLPQNTVRIAGDGEILVKGAGVARQGVPLTTDGYLKTGDTGFLDEKGYLRLTGRKSDEFKLSTGRKISPLLIESRLTQIRAVDHAVICGANHPYIVALLNISLDAWQEMIRFHGSAQQGYRFLGREIDRVTQGLAPHCRPAKFFVVHPPFTIATGEVTGNLKVRRRYVLEAFQDQFNRMYKGE